MNELAPVAALFVRKDGPYPELVQDWWDDKRDATLYDGPLPVVAHPPCSRWGRWWWADGSELPGNDGGLFESALDSVRKWGGVIEHPAASYAWAHFNLGFPENGCWKKALCGGWSTSVPQRNYGHRARKMTWLYYYGNEPPPQLDWSEPEPPAAYLTPPGRRGPDEPGDTTVERISAREAELTPVPFAELLITLAHASTHAIVRT